jgi:hypothetical protein
MTEFNIIKSKTAKTIMAALLIGFLMLSPVTVLPNVKGQINSQSLKGDDCIRAMSAQMNSKAVTLDNEKAISIANNDNEFKSKILGYNATFALIFNTWHLDQSSCSVTWSDVNVGYYLTNKTGGYVENLVVTLDPSLTEVTGVNSYIGARYSANFNSTHWSGYELGNGSNVTETYLSTNIPQVSQPTTSNYGCVPTTMITPGCDLAVWTGLEDNSRQYIVQGGSDGNLTCNNMSCTSPTYNYFLWFQFLTPSSTSSAFTCNNAAISYNDAITANVTLASVNGSTGYYDVSVQDSTIGYGCSVTNDGFSLTAPLGSTFINERANYGSNGLDELAKFTSNTITGEIAFNFGSLSPITSSQILYSDNMINPSS